MGYTLMKATVAMYIFWLIITDKSQTEHPHFWALAQLRCLASFCLLVLSLQSEHCKIAQMLIVQRIWNPNFLLHMEQEPQMSKETDGVFVMAKQGGGGFRLYILAGKH